MTTTLTQLSLPTIRDLVRPLAPVAALYLGPRPDATAVDTTEDLTLRWRGIAAQLAALGTSASTVDAMWRRVASFPAPAAEVAVMAVGEDIVFCQRIPGALPFDRVGFAAPAHVVPLLSWLQHHPAYVTVVIDRTGGDVTALTGGTTTARTHSVDGPDDEIERNAPGGWAQARYQRRAEDSWRHNAAAVAEATLRALREVGAELLLVAGDVRAVQLLRERLPDHIRPVVDVRSIPGGRQADGSASVRRVAIAEQVAGHVEDRTTALLGQFDAERGPRGLAVEGVTNTLAALAAGRVRTLLVTDDPADERTAWFGPETLCVDDSSRPAAGDATALRSGRMVDIAVRAALLTDADVRIIDASAGPALAEHIGALCRFPSA